LEASEASLLPVVLELSVSAVAEVFWLLALASFWLAGHLLPRLNKLFKISYNNDFSLIINI
jgi:hypothetical protein